MSVVQTILVIIGLPILALAAHEVTHLLFARMVSPISVEVDSYLLFRLRVEFQKVPAKSTLWLIGLAPVLVGGTIAIIAVQYGFWDRIQTAGPHQLFYLGILYWLLYIAPRPADFRLAIWPSTEQPDMQANTS